jgi:Fur family ferric uptake transcriptional regulator
MAVLFSSAVPLTADDIYIHIRDGGGEKLSLSTVYRILDTLGQKEIVAKTGLIEGGKALYEIVSGVHRHNLICIKCHKLIPLGDCPLGDFEKNLEDTTGFRISGHKFEIYGVCPDCRQIKQ